MQRYGTVRYGTVVRCGGVRWWTQRAKAQSCAPMPWLRFLVLLRLHVCLVLMLFSIHPSYRPGWLWVNGLCTFRVCKHVVPSWLCERLSWRLAVGAHCFQPAVHNCAGLVLAGRRSPGLVAKRSVKCTLIILKYTSLNAAVAAASSGTSGCDPSGQACVSCCGQTARHASGFCPCEHCMDAACRCTAVIGWRVPARS